MFELPLFPLNSVLFPGMPLQLHIFEDRYKLMIGQCIEKREPFGVVLIRRGREALGPLADPYSVGCTAQIKQVQPVGQGRMNIMAVGQERFEIVSLKHDRPYLVGMVELNPVQNRNPLGAVLQARKLRPLVGHYLQMLDRAGQLRYDSQQLPTDPMALAYLAAVLLRVPAAQQKVLLGLLVPSGQTTPDENESVLHDFTAQQQRLLECDHALTLLATLDTIYRREVAILRTMLTPPKDEKTGPFSSS